MIIFISKKMKTILRKNLSSSPKKMFLVVIALLSFKQFVIVKFFGSNDMGTALAVGFELVSVFLLITAISTYLRRVFEKRKFSKSKNQLPAESNLKAEKNGLDKAVKWSIVIGVSLFVFLVIFIPSYFFIYLPKIHTINEKRVSDCLRKVNDDTIKLLETEIDKSDRGITNYTNSEKQDKVDFIKFLEKKQEDDCYKKYPTKFQLP